MQIIFNNTDSTKNVLNSKQLNDMYRRLFLDTKEGRYIIDDLARKAGIFNSSPIDSNNLLYKEGMRAMYLYIASHLVNHDSLPDKMSDYNPFCKE